MRALFASILSPNILTYLFSILPGSFGVNINLEIFDHNKDEMLEVGTHLNNNEILLASLMLIRTLYFRDKVELFEIVDGCQFEVTHLV